MMEKKTVILKKHAESLKKMISWDNEGGENRMSKLRFYIIYDFKYASASELIDKLSFKNLK